MQFVLFLCVASHDNIIHDIISCPNHERLKTQVRAAQKEVSKVRRATGAAVCPNNNIGKHVMYLLVIAVFSLFLFGVKGN